MATPVTNLGLVTVSTTYGAGDTSIALTTGHGSKLPATTGGYTYPLTWWDATSYAHPADDPNAEIVLVTSRSTDTLTVTRGQEGTSASAKNSAGVTYRMSLGITAGMWNTSRGARNTHKGLHLATHRSNNNKASYVQLLDVESIVMDDGTELRNDSDEWTGKTAAITLSGAGGLDTGTEESSCWYEIYAIATEGGTRNLLLHKSKLWAVDTNNIAGEDEDQPIRSTSSNERVAQSVVLSNSGTLLYVDIPLVKVGLPTGNIYMRIETDNAGAPSGSVVALSNYYDVSRLQTTTPTWVSFTMSSASSVLSPSPTKYHIVVLGDWSVNASHYVAWRMDGSAAGYAAGSKLLYNGSAWTPDTDDDMMFSIITETGDAAVTMPSTYTKKCFLGWVYNNGDGDFAAFTQHGTRRRSGAITQSANKVWSCSGEIELISDQMNGVIPPRSAVTAMVAVTGTGTQPGIAAFGDKSATDISYNNDSVGAQAVIYAMSTTTRPSEFADVIVQDFGLMVHGSAGADIWIIGFEW